MGPAVRDIAAAKLVHGSHVEIVHSTTGPWNEVQGPDGSRDDRCYIYSYQGNNGYREWGRRLHGDGFVSSSLVIADVNGDGNKDVAVANRQGADTEAASIEGGIDLVDVKSGATIPGFAREFGDEVEIQGAADLDADGKAEVIAYVEQNQERSTSLQALRGEPGWPTAFEYSLPERYLHLYAINDLNGDGRLELNCGVSPVGDPIQVTELHILDSTLKLLWTQPLKTPIGGAIVSDLDADGANELIVFGDNRVTVLAAPQGK